MDEATKARLEAAGWRVGTAAEFLEMSPDEEALMEMRFALRKLLKVCREENHLSQKDLAERLGSKQPRVSKIEAADPTVSTDLLLRALVAAGATPGRIAQAIAEVTISQSWPMEENAQAVEPEGFLVAVG
jgi:predicted XRE-type DNA-binding protein